MIKLNRPNKFKIIILSGLPGTGKSTLAEDFRCLKLPVKTYSIDVIDPLLHSEGIEINRNDEMEMSNKLRKKYGNHILSELLDKKIGWHRSFVIDGARKFEEIKYFQEKYGEECVYSIVLKSSYKTRMERMKKRGIKGEVEMNYKKLRGMDSREGRDISRISRNADLIINTSRVTNDFYSNIARALYEL